jgi:phage head maturation protease
MHTKNAKQNKEYLSFEFDVKDANDDKGIIEGYGSVFGNVDFHNDVVDRDWETP